VFSDLLIHTCTIQRYTEGTADAYGNPTHTWTNYLTVPCRLVSTSGREVKVGAEVVISDWQLFLDNVDVTERDRIVTNGVTYEILLVQPRAYSEGTHHKELILRKVS